MSNFILTLDSDYRNPYLFPNNTDYNVVINPNTPGSESSSASNAATSTEVINPVFSRFMWVGTETFPLSVLTPGVVDYPSNAVSGTIFKYYGLDTFMIDFLVAGAEIPSSVDYFVGLTLMIYVPPRRQGTFPTTEYQTGLVSNYDPSTRMIRTQTPFEQDFLDRVMARTTTLTTNFVIINPSKTLGNNLVILGQNNLESLRGRCPSVVEGGFSNEDYQNYVGALALKNAPTDSLFVQNATRNWIVPMISLQPYNRTAFLALNPVVPWELTDIFQLRIRGDVLTVLVVSESIPDMVIDAVIARPGSGYSVGSVVPVSPSGSVRILSVDGSGGIVAYGWVERSSMVKDGQFLDVGVGGGVLRVVSTAPVALPISRADAVRIGDEASSGVSRFVVYIPVIDIDFFKSIAEFRGIAEGADGAYLCVSNIGNLCRPTVEPGTYVECMLYRGNMTGLEAPVVPHQQQVCYRIRLLTLILPNQPVRGFNQLPSFFPYLLLELYNTNFRSNNVMYSNNPHTDKVAFFCPIGNPRNQLISNFVTVWSSQHNIVKWSNIGYLHFRVLLPDGSTLVYKFNSTVDGINKAYNDLSENFQAFALTLVSQYYEQPVIANFQFDIIT